MAELQRRQQREVAKELSGKKKQPKKPVPKQKQGPKKVILHVPRGHKASMTAAAEAAGPVRSGKGNRPEKSSSDLGEGAFRRIASMRAKLESFRPSHHAVEDVPPAVRELIERRIALGCERLTSIVDPNDGHFIGYDFGTSTTKAVLRDPYRRSAFAVPVPTAWASMGHPHLWPTAIWHEQETDRFSLLPEPGWRCLEGFKSALIEGLGHRTCCGSPVLMAQASAAFMTLHIAYIVGAALERDPSLKIAGINIGVPVAALADASSLAMMKRSFDVGLSAIGEAKGLTHAHVADLQSPRTPIMRPEAYAELSGAIAGYCTAPRHFRGGHMIIDCGSATLDIASFTLGDPQWPIGIHAARVEPLGADSCLTYIVHGATSEECRRACRFLEFEVFRETAQRSSGFAQERDKYPYQIILVGGGIHSEVHKPLLDGMRSAFHRELHHPELARDLDYDRACEPGRLILADGLARAPIDLRDVAMPADRPRPAPRDCTPDMITKDQV